VDSPEDQSHIPLSAVERLSKNHNCSRFESGEPSLDEWLQKYALINQKTDISRTYVVHRGGAVTGYYAISAGSVTHEEAPLRIKKGLPKHPIPVILLARLAVDASEQGRGLGRALLKDALFRIMHAADEIGARAVLVHALHDKARRFYEQFDFEPSPVNPLQLMLLMKDLRANLHK